MDLRPDQRDRSGSSSSTAIIGSFNTDYSAQSVLTDHMDINRSEQMNNGNKEQASDGLLGCIDDLEAEARVKMEKIVYDYYRHGADEEHTLRWNRSMISAMYCLKPKLMVDVSRVSLTKYIFGDKIACPIGVSPTALHKMAHPEGELGTIRACKRANALMILSFFSTTSLEDVAKEAPATTKWQNLYILKNREMTRSVINRAKRFGYRAIVITCDAPCLGKRRSDEQNKLQLCEYPLANIDDSDTMSMKEHATSIFDPSVTWQDLAEIKKYVGDTIRVIAKGITTPEDAEAAIKAGVDAIFVSNHGGRQLDCMQSTIEALPAIVRVVNKRCPVFVDGGFRTGVDILKALAVGADMVFVGRPALWGLASDGEEGVYRALKILEDELRRAMMFCGCTKLDDINESVVIQRNNLSLK